MNYKRFKKYIVVDENRKPMTFQKPQLVYCDTELSRRPLPLETYDLFHAKEYIRISNEYADKVGMERIIYLLMPIK